MVLEYSETGEKKNVLGFSKLDFHYKFYCVLCY